MEIEEVRYDSNAEYMKVHAICEYCNHGWFPYYTKQRLPFEAKLKCPECEEFNTFFWADSKINREMLRRKYVLSHDEEIIKSKATIENLTKERDEWKNRCENESEKNTILTKTIDRLSEKLEQLGVEIDDEGENPLSS